MLIDALRGGPAICFMDDPVPILDAGRWSQSDNNVSRFLRPYMESGDISIICETHRRGARRGAADRSRASSRRSTASTCPSRPRARGAHPRRAAGRWSASARPAGSPSSRTPSRRAVELTRRFEPYRAFPGKAIAALEETVRESAGDTGELHRSAGDRGLRRAYRAAARADRGRGAAAARRTSARTSPTRVLGQDRGDRGDGRPDHRAQGRARLPATSRSASLLLRRPDRRRQDRAREGARRVPVRRAGARWSGFDMGEYAAGDAVAS